MTKTNKRQERKNPLSSLWSKYTKGFKDIIKNAVSEYSYNTYRTVWLELNNGTEDVPSFALLDGNTARYLATPVTDESGIALCNCTIRFDGAIKYSRQEEDKNTKWEIPTFPQERPNGMNLTEAAYKNAVNFLQTYPRTKCHREHKRQEDTNEE